MKPRRDPTIGGEFRTAIEREHALSRTFYLGMAIGTLIGIALGLALIAYVGFIADARGLCVAPAAPVTSHEES